MIPSEASEPLNLYLSKRGIASRRKAAELISQGHVKVNGIVITHPGTRLSPNAIVTIDNQIIEEQTPPKIWIAFYKPIDVECSMPTKFTQKTIFDIVKIPKIRLFSVGRLDKNSEGLLLMTNDGEGANQLTHPRYEIKKIYIVDTDRPLAISFLRILTTKGIINQGEHLRAESIKMLTPTRYQITLQEGKKREIRRMIEDGGCHTLNLCRIAFGPITLSNLNAGEWRNLSSDELEKLSQSVKK